MKNVKLSLCALAVLSCFQTLSASPLDEAIKDIDVSGVLRYRYHFVNGDATQTKQYQNWGGSRIRKSNQRHGYRAEIGFRGAISDDFKLSTHLGYSGASDGGYGQNSVSNTTKSLAVRQIYLTYTNEDLATEILLGRQFINTIWASSSSFKEGAGKDIYGGLIGQGVKVINNSIEGLTLSLFAFDSFAWDRTGLTSFGDGTFGDLGSDIQANVGSWIARKNLYGASALGSYEFTEGKLNSQFWLGLIPNRAVLYALDLSYKTTLFDDVDYTITGTYLGNSVSDIPKKQGFKNGNYVQLNGSLKVDAWDFKGGILHYGDKHKKTFTTIEDVGGVNTPGVDIMYTNGSRINGDLGKNTFAYLGAGYTFFQKLRLGAKVAYGGTRVGKHEPFYAYQTKGTPIELVGQAGKKSEFTAEARYTYSAKLAFSTYFTQININRKSVDGHKNIARFQVFYKF